MAIRRANVMGFLTKDVPQRHRSLVRGIGVETGDADISHLTNYNGKAEKSPRCPQKFREVNTFLLPSSSKGNNCL